MISNHNLFVLFLVDILV